MAGRGKRRRVRKRHNRDIVYDNEHVTEYEKDSRTLMQTNYGNTVLASGKLTTKKYDKSKLRGQIDKTHLYDYVKPRYGVIIKRRFIKTVFDRCMDKRKVS